MLSVEQGQKLIKLARESITISFSGENLEPDSKIVSEFSENQGVFVTLHEDGKLRGCIGFPMPSLPLYEAVISAAKSAAFQDPRFSPIKEKELGKIDLEISVLTVPEEIKEKEFKKLNDIIKIGRDGLIIKYGYASGLLLPQVATEYSWTVNEFLMHTCNKAGLDPFAWKQEDVRLFKFQAQVFHENKK